MLKNLILFGHSGTFWVSNVFIFGGIAQNGTGSMFVEKESVVLPVIGSKANIKVLGCGGTGDTQHEGAPEISFGTG